MSAGDHGRVVSSRRLIAVVGVLCLLVTGSPECRAQGVVGGVLIDPEGMLREATRLSDDARLAALRQHVAADPGPEFPANASALRKISLRRLERLVAEHHQTERPLPAEIEYLAGLTGIRSLVFVPESGDVVLAGPAEPWEQQPTGEITGRTSKRPVLHLDDLIVALRFAHDRTNRDGFLGCSIEPTPEGVRNYEQYARQLGQIDRTRLDEIFGGMERAMGPQAIHLFGIHGSSRAAFTMVAADYRLKRLAMGHDPSPLREVTSYLDLAARRLQNVARAQPQHRWWFVGKCESLAHSADRRAFAFRGLGLKVETAASFPGQSDDDEPQKKPHPLATQFARAMTQHLPELSRHVPVFGELENLVTLAVAAELIRQETASSFREATMEGEASSTGESDRRQWRPGHFLDSGACPVRTYPVPRTTPSLASYRLIRGRHWLISISGGVEIDPAAILKTAERQPFPKEEEGKSVSKLILPTDESRWWWD